METLGKAADTALNRITGLRALGIMLNNQKSFLPKSTKPRKERIYMIGLLILILALAVLIGVPLTIFLYFRHARHRRKEKLLQTQEAGPRERAETKSEQLCRHCGTPNPITSKFCKRCGRSLSTLEACPQCGSKLDPEAIFCQECGFRIEKQEITPTTPVMKRLPLGLEILIVFGALGAGYYFFSGAMLFHGMGIVGGIISPDLRSQLTLVGALWLLLGAFLAVVSWGLWHLKEWARKLLIINALLAMVGAFFDIIPGLLGLIYSAIILWYITRRHIKILFETGRVSGIETPLPVISMVRRACPSCGRIGKPGAKFCVKCGVELKEMKE